MTQPLITIRHGETLAEVAPWRGSIVTRFAIGTEEIFYLDPATLHDRAKSVRGGNPLLFPFAGSLADGTFLPANTKIKQHGFGRDYEWSVMAEREAAVMMEMTSNDETHEIFPWDFHLAQMVGVGPRSLEVELHVGNADTTPFPVAPGWHPYFPCSLTGKANVQVDLPGFDHSRFATGAFDFGVETNGIHEVGFVIDGRRHRLSFSDNMHFAQFWSLGDKPFICVEPFTGAPNVINTPKAVMVPPGRTVSFRMKITVD